jgi:hypothetical protein
MKPKKLPAGLTAFIRPSRPNKKSVVILAIFGKNFSGSKHKAEK